MNDSTLNIPTLEISNDAIYDTTKIRKYNRKRGIKSNKELKS